MSTLIDRLKQVSQPASRPMGFGARTSTTRTRLQLLAHIEPASLANKVTNADAIALPSLKKGNGETIRGIWFKKGDLDEVDQAIEVGADFIVLPATGNVISPEKKIGKVLQVNSDNTDTLLRAVNELPVDAILLNEDKEDLTSLTWQRLMLLNHFSGLLSKPVLVKVAMDISGDELQMIWDTGVSGIVVDISTESEAVEVKGLSEKIEKLKFPVKKKRGELSAVLPSVSGHVEEEHEDEEPDEDDDDQ